MREVLIAGAARTAVGNFGGALKDVSAAQLGAIVVAEALKRAGVRMESVDEVIMGNVIQAGQGQNPARQASIKAGLPDAVAAMTVNKVCGSGLKAIALGAQAIIAGDADIVVAGGMESMSQAPFLLKNARWGYKMGNSTLVDAMIQDGLWEIFNNYHMGRAAENLAEKFGITRVEQDRFAYDSQMKTKKAQEVGRFRDEIVPVKVALEKNKELLFDTDEFPRPGTTVEVLAKLKTPFKENGTVTAGNASGINDGAAVVVLVSNEKAKELGIGASLGRIRSYSAVGVAPHLMGIGPVDAVKKALAKADATLDSVDLIESNEAFAVQSLAVAQALGWDAGRLNVNGGAIALGHPIGASGARILVTLLYEMKKRDSRRGLATLCIGGGMGIAMVVDR